MRCVEGIIDSLDMSLSELQDIVKDQGGGNAAAQGVAKSEP